MPLVLLKALSLSLSLSSNAQPQPQPQCQPQLQPQPYNSLVGATESTAYVLGVAEMCKSVNQSTGMGWVDMSLAGAGGTLCVVSPSAVTRVLNTSVEHSLGGLEVSNSIHFVIFTVIRVRECPTPTPSFNSSFNSRPPQGLFLGTKFSLCSQVSYPPHTQK